MSFKRRACAYPSAVEIVGDRAEVVMLGRSGQERARAVIDVADVPIVSGARWHLNAGGYACTGVLRDGRPADLTMQRAILGDVPDGLWIDHINGNRLDNRRANLRAVTPEQNTQNRRGFGSSGHRNVYWQESHQAWMVAVRHNDKLHHGGRFKNINDAVQRAAEMRAQLFGEGTPNREDLD